MSSSQDDDNTIISTTSTGQARSPAKTRTCPKCGLTVTDNTMVCPVDGTAIFEAPGKILADTYEFVSVTGWGGMSVIYKARQRQNGHVVAIKMLHSLLMTDQSLRRFQQEAKAIMSLRHPNIIAVHDFGVSEHGQPYMVMDFIEGKTLGDVIKETNGLSLEASLHRFIQLCDALDHAHQVGVLHRDLKPSNIMISNQDGNFEDARIVDFGIAKLLDKEEGADDDGHLTHTGELFGSPLYMSPEQCRGSEVDARTDIYSLGCVMYETLTGRTPFRGATIVDTLMLQMSEIPVSLAEASPDKQFPVELENVIAKALAKDPDDRYQTMQDLEMALMGIQLNSSNVSRGKSRTKTRKTPIIPKFVYGAAIAFLVVAFGFRVWWQSISKHENTVTAAQVDAIKKTAVLSSIEAKHDQQIVSNNIETLLKSKKNMIDDPMLRQRLNVDLGLEELDLNKAQVGDVGCQFLRNQRTLKRLYLDDTYVRDQALAVAIATLDKLEKLSLCNTKISDNAIGYLTKLTNIWGIYLNDCKDVADKTLESVGSMPRLKELSLNSTAVTDRGFESLRRISLKKLFASRTKFGDKGMGALSNMNSLTELLVRDTKVSDEGLAKLKHAPELTSLDLSKTSITNKGMGYLARFPLLDSLGVAENPITDGGTAVLAKLTKLDRLNLESTKISDATLLHLAKLSKLRELNLKNDQITDAGLETISQMDALQALNLTGTGITDTGLHKLLSSKHLNNLVIANCLKLTAPGVKDFSDHKKDCNVVATEATYIYWFY
jgi:serine/threonine-protein kinase